MRFTSNMLSGNDSIYRRSITVFNLARTCSATSRNFRFSMAYIDTMGSTADISTLPSSFSCTTTLQGSITPILSSSCSA